MSKPFGIYKIKIKKGTEVVTLPSARKLKFKVRSKSAEFEGDESLQAVASRSNGIEWELEAGGMPLEAWAMMSGRTVSTTGETPARVSKLTIGQDSYPYIEIYGESAGDGDDNVHVHLVNAKITDDGEGSQNMGEWLSTAIKGLALKMEVIENETAADLPADA